MGLVIAILVALVAGCYEPELRDCTVTCAAADECAQGQSCTATGFCAASGATCTSTPDMPDARAADAPMHDGAVALYMLKVTVNNKGQVTVDNVGTCTSGMGMNTVCPFQVLPGVKIVAHAQVTDQTHMFDKWNDPICKDQDSDCSFTPLPITAIEAQFK